MNIEKNKVVAFHYTLKDKDGKVLDTSAGKEPLEYLHGFQNIVPGLEKEMEGLKIGDKKNVEVAPEEGYGVHQKELIISVPREAIDFPGKIEKGMAFHAQSKTGQIHQFVVVDADDKNIQMDGNHPLAGATLYFDVEVTNVREATEKELKEGHPHMEGCGCGCHGGEKDHECDCDGDCDCGGNCSCEK